SLTYQVDCYSVVAYALSVTSARAPSFCSQCTVVPGRVRRLLGVKRLPEDAVFSWDAEALSTGGYHLYGVAPKTLIPVATTTGSQACAAGPGQLSCTHQGILHAAPSLLFYQVVGVCGDGLTEGPM